MGPQTRVEFVVLKLTYFPLVNPPKIKMSRKKRSSSGSEPQVKDWFDRIMTKEKSNIPYTVKESYCEWIITTGNANLFTINGYRYNQILLVLGKDSVHWVYYKHMCQHRRLEGHCPLTVNYCRCCFNKQYLKVMESVKSSLMKHDIEI